MRTEAQAVMSAAPSIDPLNMRQLAEVLNSTPWLD